MRPMAAPGILIGFGLGGFFDGILFHRIEVARKGERQQPASGSEPVNGSTGQRVAGTGVPVLVDLWTCFTGRPLLARSVQTTGPWS